MYVLFKDSTKEDLSNVKFSDVCYTADVMTCQSSDELAKVSQFVLLAISVNIVLMLDSCFFHL